MVAELGYRTQLVQFMRLFRTLVPAARITMVHLIGFKPMSAALKTRCPGSLDDRCLEGLVGAAPTTTGLRGRFSAVELQALGSVDGNRTRVCELRTRRRCRLPTTAKCRNCAFYAVFPRFSAKKCCLVEL